MCALNGKWKIKSKNGHNNLSDACRVQIHVAECDIFSSPKHSKKQQLREIEILGKNI